MDEIKPSHFEAALKYARRSVSPADVIKYHHFARTLQGKNETKTNDDFIKINKFC